jgi:hypothetical protein
MGPLAEARGLFFYVFCVITPRIKMNLLFPGNYREKKGWQEQGKVYTIVNPACPVQEDPDRRWFVCAVNLNENREGRIVVTTRKLLSAYH